jgi:2-methylcitrate dehydratase PrpD
VEKTVMSQTETLVRYVSEGKFEDLPPPVVNHAKHCIMDVISCGLGGRKTPDADLLIDMMKEIGGNPEATVIGDQTKLSFMRAAQVNRVMTNMLDYDDDYMKVGHMTTVLVPVAFALGERLNSSGKDIINAIVHGYEAIIRIRDAVDPSPEAYVKTFEQVDAAIHFGVTVVAGKLLGLTVEQMADAFGLTGFVRAWRTTRPDRAQKGMPRWMKITGGDISIPGIHGAFLAKRGFSGDRQVLDQGRGYEIVAGSDRYDATKLTIGLGEVYRMLRIGFKFFPACRYTCSALDAMSELVAENKIKADDVGEVVVRGQRHLYQNFRIYEPEYMIQGQFSIPYVVTMALTGVPRMKWYADETLKDLKLRATQRKIKVEEDPVQTERFYTHYTAGTTVEIRMKDGRQFSRHVEYPKGEPENPFSEQDHIDKLTWMASHLGMEQGRINELLRAFNRFEELKGISELTRLLVPQ